MITQKFLERFLPTTSPATLAKFVDPLKAVMAKYEIDTSIDRVAAFLAQCAHESGGFTQITENLNYSAHSLLKVFPRYFPTQELAVQYARRPQAIAARVYANRMSNGDEASQDGWTYRGRGLIQLTGRNNYARLSKAFGMSLGEVTTYLESTEGACFSAGWFWDTNKLNDIVDTGNFVLLTKRINGGTIGLEHREQLYIHALDLLAGD